MSSVVISGDSSGTVTIAAPAVAGSGTQTLQAGSGTVALDNTFGYKNRLINGCFRVDQRNNGASQTITAAAALAYTVDRWYAYCTGANVTGQRVAGTGSNQYNYQFTGAASVTGINFAQRIETLNSYDLNGQNVKLSVYMSNSLLTSVTWTAYYANTSDTFGSVASPTVTSIATGTFTVSSTYSQYSATIAIPSAATTGIQIVFSVGAQTSGTWVIGYPQLELGTTATSFDIRDHTRELSMCQRYFESTYESGTSPGATSQTANSIVVYAQANSSTVSQNLSWYYRVTKRTSPTVTLYNPSTGATGTFRNITQNTNINASQFCVSSNLTNYASQAAGIAANETYCAHYTASAEL